MRTKTLLTTTAAVATMGLTASLAQAGTLLYEGFDYDSTLSAGDSIATANGGTGWTGAWVDEKNGGHKYTAGLTYTNGATLVTTGGAIQDPDTSDLESSRAYDASLIGNSGTYWFSYLIQTGNSALEEIKFESGRARGGADGFGTDNGEDFGNGLVGGEINSDRSGSVAVTGSTMFVLGKMELVDGGDDTLSVWFNTDLTLAEGALGTADSSVTAELVQGGNVIFFTTGGGHIGILDEIRLGETYADVTPVPEPGSLALLGLGGLCVLRRRRG